MPVDFSPLMNLMISLMPLILFIVLIGVIVAVLGKMGKLSFGLFFAIVGMGALAGGMMLLPPVGASLSPDSGTLVMGLPTPFTCDGITASTACHINVTVGGTETTAIATVTSNTDGEISFSLIFTNEGSTLVEVGEGAVGSAANIQSGTFDVTDMVGTIVTYVVFIVEIIVVFAIVGIIVGLLRKIGR